VYLKAAEAQLHMALHEAAGQGQHQMVQQLLDAGADVNEPDYHGRTPLYAASCFCRQEVVQVLLAAQGTDVNAADANGLTPLYIAANAGHLEVVQQLLAAGANVNAEGNSGSTPLHAAAGWGRVAVVALLLRYGANPRLRHHDDLHYTALHYAADGGNTAVVQQLLEAWGEPQVPAADLVSAAKAAAQQDNMATFSVLAQELQKLYPEELRQLFVGQHPVDPVAAAAAMAEAWVADVSSIDEQRAAVRRREVDVAQEKAAVQQLILGVAGMAKAAQG
jgi:hypothetical protein